MLYNFYLTMFILKRQILTHYSNINKSLNSKLSMLEYEISKLEGLIQEGAVFRGSTKTRSEFKAFKKGLAVNRDPETFRIKESNKLMELRELKEKTQLELESSSKFNTALLLELDNKNLWQLMDMAKNFPKLTEGVKKPVKVS